jgi:uncharacterized protein (TIGR03083 family)
MTDNSADLTTEWLAALSSSHQQLADLISPMSDAEVASPSYASEWSIAQVLSHLGSGGEIFEMFLEAGLDGTPVPEFARFQEIWDEWNAKTPHDQSHDGVRSNAAFLARVRGMDATQREAWQLEMFGSEQHLADLLRLRLSEHALHTWDVAVAADAAATLTPEATVLLIDNLDFIVERTGKAQEQPVSVVVTTSQPEREFRLHAADDAVRLTPQDPGVPPESTATLRLPAEALIRLVYGRLDDGHTPPIEVEGVDVNTLRQLFPGP